MTSTHIESSIMKWLEDEVGQDAIHSPVEQVDVVMDDLETWMEGHLTALRSTSQRRNQPLDYHYRLTVHCGARSNTDLYAVNRLVDEIVSLCDRVSIPIYDYATSLPTQVGVAKFKEPSVYDNSENIPTGDGKWQSRRVQIDVTCEAL